MSDIVDRLRASCDVREAALLRNLAADELDRLNSQALELCAEISGLRRENERLRGLLRECEPAVYAQHMDTLGTRIAKPATLLARVRAALAGAADQSSAVDQQIKTIQRAEKVWDEYVKRTPPCPLCGRTDPHSHMAGPWGMP